ncbi:MAG: RHS repeat domain-containing protein [Terriglobales bacterium]
MTYTYDGDGLRVKKSNGKLYWRSIGIDALAETDLAGNNPVEFIYFAGLRVALRDAAGGVYFIFADHLGSARVLTNATGAPCRDVDFFPFGGEKITLNTCPLLNYKFATHERDPETGLDYAIFRYYNSRLGRFMSPDLLDGGAGNPQSFNRYSYVVNDPINLTDPLGLVALPCWLDFFSSQCWPGEGGGGWGWGPILIPIEIGRGRGGGGSGGGGGGTTGGSSGGGTTGGNFPNGETLGIPNGMQFPQLTLCQLIGLCPIGPSCDFGGCRSPFQAGVIPVAVECAANPVCLGAALRTAIVVVAAVGQSIYSTRRNIEKAQEKEARRRIEKICGKKLTRGERRRLHDLISRQGYRTIEEIVEDGVTEFCNDVRTKKAQ